MSAEAETSPPRRLGRLLALTPDGWATGGGIAQYNRDFLAAAAAEWDVVLLPRRAAEGTAPARIHQARAPRGKLRYVAAAARRASAMRARGGASKTVLFCGHLNLAGAALAAAAASGAALVVQAHGIEAWPRPGRFGRTLLRRADLALSVSRATRARLAEWSAAAPERLAVLPNTVHPRFSPAAQGGGDAAAFRAAINAEGAHLLLTVGRLSAAERYKGHDRVIALLPALEARLRRETGRGVRYAILGDGDDRLRLEALAAAQGASAQVCFWGRAASGELLAAYRAADLYVMPSTGEGFGIAYLEAMACGTPALGLSAGGAPDPLDLAPGGAVAPAALEDALLSRLCAPEATLRGPALAATVHARFGRAAFDRRARALLRRAAGCAEPAQELWARGASADPAVAAARAEREAAA